MPDGKSSYMMMKFWLPFDDHLERILGYRYLAANTEDIL
jgi:hypothetical protein